MNRILPYLLIACLLFTSIGCNQVREKPQYSQEQDMIPPQYSEDRDDNNPEYNEDANNVKTKYERPDRTVGYWIPEEIKRSIVQMKNVKDAEVVITRGEAFIGKRDAFIGIRLDKPISKQELKQLKQNITSNAMRMEPNLDHVYISTKEDFFKEVENYQKHVKKGFPDQRMEKHLHQLLEKVNQDR